MSIDSLLPANEAGYFVERGRQMLNTVEAQGITADNAVIIGGCAFKLYGLNTYVELPREAEPQAFDLDVFRVPRTPEPPSGKARRQYRRDSGFTEIPGTAETLMITIIDGMASDRVSKYFGYESYDQMLGHRVIIDGLATLPLGKLAFSKVGRGGRKDLAGLIKAQLYGFEEANPNINDVGWSNAVKKAMYNLDQGQNGKFDPYLSTKRPGWLNTLIANRFEHPAFEGLRTKYGHVED